MKAAGAKLQLPFLKGRNDMDIEMLLKPVMGAFIGYSTNWLAIKMLFRPYRKITVAGIPVPLTPGLIPRERDRIAASLGSAVGKRLLTTDVIVKELTSPAVIASMRGYIMDALTKQPMTLNDLITILFGDAAEEQKERMAAHIAKSLAESLQDKEDNVLDNLIRDSREDIAGFISSELDKEALREKLEGLVQNLIEEKLGALGAMFVDAGSLTRTLTLKIQEVLAREEAQDMLAGAIISGKDELMARKLGADGIKGQVAFFLEKYLDQPFELTPEDREAIEGILENQYIKFAKGHIPVFIESFNVENVVEREIASFSIKELEELIFAIVDKELKAITWFGALLGFVLGLFLI